jgi:glycine cleavage system pyridoxal-binding protein P
MRYLPHTPEEIASMLETVGLSSLDALHDPIPERARFTKPLDMLPALDEASLMRHLEDMAGKNRAASMLSFLGAGAYDHHFPPAADQLLLRSEFYTAYTPYQPEVAQGTLQVIYEFQTIVSEIFGLPVANASMYDGASSAAEAILMARRLVNREHTVISAGVHPEYIGTIETHVRQIGRGKESLTYVPVGHDGAADIAGLCAAITNETACVVVGYPNFYGSIADLRELAKVAHEKGALLITVTQDPFALALLEPPGAFGADIAVGEGQPLGLPPQFGGPNVGLFACRDDRKYLQQIPGRLVVKRSTRMASAGMCSRWRRASSIFVASGRRATFARTVVGGMGGTGSVARWPQANGRSATEAPHRKQSLAQRVSHTREASVQITGRGCNSIPSKSPDVVAIRSRPNHRTWPIRSRPIHPTRFQNCTIGRAQRASAGGI